MGYPPALRWWVFGRLIGPLIAPIPNLLETGIRLCMGLAERLKLVIYLLQSRGAFAKQGRYLMNGRRKIQPHFFLAAILLSVCPVIAGGVEDPEQILNAITINEPRLHAEKSSFMAQKIMSFTVKNGSKSVIKTLYFRAKLQTPGRALPWIETDQSYTFPGGLEPGETRHLDLAPNMFGEWGKTEDQWIKTGVFSVSVRAIDDAAGNKITSSHAAER